jgi:ribose/xylose/arabinose/galactoside ABC-type transport system permease subunit
MPVAVKQEAASEMVYDDSRYGGDSGYRDDPYQSNLDAADSSLAGRSLYTPSSYSSPDYPSRSTIDSTGGTLGLGQRSSTRLRLDDVFDDPNHGDPGRDRMAPHILWELVLVLGVAAVVYLLRMRHPETFKGAGLRELMLSITIVGLLTMSMGLSLRAAVVNLAVGPIGYASALFYLGHATRGPVYAGAVTGLVAAAVGMGLAVVIVGFHVPSWAASLAAGFLLIAWIERQAAAQLPRGSYRPGGHAVYWLAGFVLLAVLGNLLGTVKPVRRTLGRFRPVADPARRRGAGAAVIAILALVGSSVLASAGGVLLASATGKLVPAGSEFELTGAVGLTGLALGAALLSGTSAFGRRGGVFGTALAAALIVVGGGYVDTTKWQVPPIALAAAAIILGLLVTRMVESYGRPEALSDNDDWRPSGSAESTGWSMTRSSSWNSAAAPTPLDGSPSSASDPWGIS